MHMLARLSALVLTAALTACGDSSNAFPFKSVAADPVGERITIRYDLKPGDGVRMTMQMTGAMEMSGSIDRTLPLDQRFVMTLQCTDVTAEGDLVVAMAVESASLAMGGADLPDGAISGLEDLKGTWTVGRDGKIKSMDWTGGDPLVAAQMKQTMNNPGFQYFMPMPEGGMRVGEALDLTTILSHEALEQLMNQAMPGGGLKPDLQGEFVLKGTQDFDGETAAEFEVNMVMNFAGTIRQPGTELEMDMGMRITGQQFSSLRTGLPLGTANWTMEMRMDGEGSDSEVAMHMKGTMTISSEPLAR